jgi:hypothetical protein
MAQVGSAGTCTRCGKKLGLRERVLGRQLCRECAAEEGEGQKKRRRLYLGAITALDLRTDLGPVESGVLSGMTPDSLGPEWHQSIATGALRFLYEQAVESGSISADQDRRITEAARVLRIDRDAVARSAPHLETKVALARANGGILPVLARPQLRLRPGEICYFETNAHLLPEAVGVGVARTAATGPQSDHGRWVPRGQPIAPSIAAERLVPMGGAGIGAETGRLLITSERIVFRSRRRTVHVVYARVISFGLYSDGLRIRLSGRKRARGFRLQNAPLVAALANAASINGNTGVQPSTARAEGPAGRSAPSNPDPASVAATRSG